jgi:hypothetical protein
MRPPQNGTCLSGEHYGICVSWVFLRAPQAPIFFLATRGEYRKTGKNYAINAGNVQFLCDFGQGG